MGRYDLYNMIDKNICFRNKGADVQGFCTDVRREALDNRILVIVNVPDTGITEFQFSEPNTIEQTEDGTIVFVYGIAGSEDMVEFCGEDFNVKWGEDIRKSIGRERAVFRVEFKIL